LRRPLDKHRAAFALLHLRMRNYVKPRNANRIWMAKQRACCLQCVAQSAKKRTQDRAQARSIDLAKTSDDRPGVARPAVNVSSFRGTDKRHMDRRVRLDFDEPHYKSTESSSWLRLCGFGPSNLAQKWRRADDLRVLSLTGRFLCPARPPRHKGMFWCGPPFMA
jgi:hypothetical protein